MIPRFDNKRIAVPTPLERHSECYHLYWLGYVSGCLYGLHTAQMLHYCEANLNMLFALTELKEVLA